MSNFSLLFFLILSRLCFAQFQSILPYSLEKIPQSEFSMENIIIGDDFAQELSKDWRKLDLEVRFNKYYSLTRSLARTQELKGAKKVIYFGNHNELTEQRMAQEDVDIFLENYEDYHHSYKKYVLKYLPFLKTLFFSNYKNLKNIPSSLTLKKTQIKEVLKYKEAVLKLYSLELKKLINIAKKKEVKLLFITTPINYKQSVPLSCLPIKEGNLNFYKRMKKYENQGAFPKAYALSKALSLKEHLQTDILFHHSLIAEHLGKKSEALKHFSLLSTNHCDLLAPDENFNNVLRKVANIYDIPLFDLAKEIKNQYLKGNIKSFDRILYSKKIRIKLFKIIKKFIEK